MLLKAIYIQIIVLFAVLLWLFIIKRRSSLDTLFKLLTITILFFGLWLGGVWVFPPVYGLLIAALIFSGLSVYHLRQNIARNSRWRAILSNSPTLVLLPLGSFLLWQGIAGRLDPAADVIDLDPPFKSEKGICVLSGGLSPLLNFHIFPSESPRDLAQTYGLDIIKVRTNGFRTTSGHTLNPKPQTAEAYAIFNTPVYAPCYGTVAEYENDQPDQPIGGSDKTNTGGNGVVLQCGGYHVHLHHLKRGSVIPKLGDVVMRGQEIGKIGNSGNTIEPHLHLHAETIIEPGNTHSHGTPVHMNFQGRFMARGDCF